jgi:hypothetical protein
MAKLKQNLVWMYFNIGSKKKKVQSHDVELSLFLCFMCKIIIFKIMHNYEHIILNACT